MPKTLFSNSLPQPAYSATQVLSHEKQLAIDLDLSLFELMTRAGHQSFNITQQLYPTLTEVLVVCGKGNNGGDGFIFALKALENGIAVRVLSTASPEQMKDEAKQAYQLLIASQGENPALNIVCSNNLAGLAVNIKEFKGPLVVDSLFGIGLNRPLSSEYLSLIEAINGQVAEVVSLDIPSGLNATTGTVDELAVVANITITFIVAKQGLLTGQGLTHIGTLYLADLDIGIDFIQSLTPKVFIQGVNDLPLLTYRHASMHKGSIGLALMIGGNEGMPGAIKLASEGALRSGAALVAVCCHHQNQAMVFNNRPELMLAPPQVSSLADSSFLDKAKVLLIGPGLGMNDWAYELFVCALKQPKPIVVDADALRILSQKPTYKEQWVLTPHPGEAASLLNTDIATIEHDRFSAVRAIAKKYGGICVLKGAGSLISDGESVWINQTGNSGMASGGMGDVLSGIIAGLILQSPSLLDAVRLAVSIHGQAADAIVAQVGQRGLLASDLFEPLRLLVNRY